MSEGIPYADIVILALIAGFILLRLRSVLGQKDDGGPDFLKGLQKPYAPSEAIVKLTDKSKLKPPEEPDPYLATLENTDISGAVSQIKDKDPTFSATFFLNGAKLAYEMVFDAFAKGDKQTLKMLLSDERYNEFSREIDARDGDERKKETTLVSVAAKAITHASLDKNTARLSVSFASEQVNLVRDREGAIVEGNASDIHHVEDEWTFSRDVTSKNPNWKIVET